MKHLINKLQFEIYCPEENYALTLRHNFALTFQQQIEQIIDQVCSKYSSDAENIRIDKLELDLGIFSPHTFDTTFAPVLLLKFEQGLVEKLKALPSEDKLQSAAYAEIELLQHFLLTGRLPWWVDENEIHFNEVVDKLFFKQSESIRDFLSAHCSNEHLWKRIAFQLNKDIKSQIISFFSELTGSESLLKIWIKTIIETYPHFSTTIHLHDHLLNLLLRFASELFQTSGSIASLRTIFEAHTEQFFTSLTGHDRIQIAEVLDTILDPQQNFETHTEERKPYENDVDDKEEKYTVKQAGVILLAQFLKPFFAKLDFLQDSVWKDKESQYKAIHMLRFLCTGEKHCPEFNLTLEKLLCGVPLEEPIPIAISFSDEEMKEAVLLLQSVIEHWQALKKTSVEGLRETFLKREGIITRSDGNWQLQVERKTVDVLLDKIPWGFSMVMLPWNDYLIYVEW